MLYNVCIMDKAQSDKPTGAQSEHKYGEKDYWEGRYSKALGVYEWLQPWKTVKSYLIKHFFSNSSVLNVGCGTSNLELDLCQIKMCRSIISIDISPTVINSKKEAEGLKYLVMDCTDMSFEASTFDIVIDKSTLDSILCAGEIQAKKYIDETFRVLREGGKLLILSYASPNQRLKYLRDFNVTYEIIQEKSFLYICQKPNLQQRKQVEQDLMQM